MGKASTDTSLTLLEKKRRVQNDEGHKPFKRIHSNKYLRPDSAAPVAVADRKEQAENRTEEGGRIHPIILKDVGICFKCRKGKRMAFECPEK